MRHIKIHGIQKGSVCRAMLRLPTNRMKRRGFFIVIVVLFFFLFLIFRLWYLQILEFSKYKQMAEKQQMRSTVISSKRGCIYDRNMKVLAKSASAWNVVVSPKDIETDEEREKISQGLARILNVEKEFIKDKTKRETYYEIVKRKVEKSVADEVIQFLKDNKLKGVRLEEDNKRYYPYNDLAASIIGFTGMEGQGLAGIEAYCERILRGENGKVIVAKNGKSKDMPFKYEERFEPKDGNSVVLTIDEVLQHFLEKHLVMAVKEHRVKNKAAGIIMDVQTGEVLAMATKPDFDPNKPTEIFDKEKLEEIEKIHDQKEKQKEILKEQNLQWRNKAVSDPYEPGSVFKIITACTALETGSAKMSDTYCCLGSITVGGQTIRCWKHGGHGMQDFSQAVMHSCNPWFINIGQKVGPEKFRQYFKAFGFTELTGIDIPGEAESIYHPMRNFKIVELASSSMGQTFKVTPIQLITGVSAAVNGGNLYKPYVVKQIINRDGRVIKNIAPVLKRQVISSQTSKNVALMCEGVVKEGSGRNAYIKGQRIGGKTGTSEKIDKKVDGEVREYILSFLGFAPANDPKIAVLVLLDEPGSVGYGSVMAAPVVGGIMADALPYLGIDPQYTQEEIENMDMNIPHLVGESIEQAKARLESKGLKYNVVANPNENLENAKVIKQIPAGGTKVPGGSVIMLYSSEEVDVVTREVPDVIGQTAFQASRLLGQSLLNIRITGADINMSGTVAKKQEPEPGTQVVAGTVVTVEFINTEKME